MSTRRAKTTTTSKKPMSEAEKKLKELDEQKKMIHDAHRTYQKGRDKICELGTGDKMVIRYTDRKGRIVESDPMTKRDYGTKLTDILKAQDALYKAYKDWGTKKESRQSSERIKVGVLNDEFFNAFMDLVNQLPKVVRKLIDDMVTSNEQVVPVSKKLLTTLVRLYVYEKQLYRGAGDRTKGGKESLNKFRLDDTLLDLFRKKSGDDYVELDEDAEVIQIQIASLIGHLIIDAATVPNVDDWVFPDPPKKDRDGNIPEVGEFNRLERYNAISYKLHSEWSKERGKDEEYPVDIEDEAARKVLEEEGIKLKGNLKEVTQDTVLLNRAPALATLAIVDYIANLAEDEADAVKKRLKN